MLFPLLATLLAVVGPVAPDTPARMPQVAVSGSTIGLTFGAGNRIYFSASQDGGKSFSTPVQVAEAAILPLTRHRGPRIVFSGGAIVISAVTGRKLAVGPHAHGLPSDGDLRVWRSTDGGKTWSKGTAVNDVGGAATEGLHALAAGGKTLFAAWLDKRGKGTTLHGSISNDGGATWSKNVLVYQSPQGTICECCHPSVAIDAGGQVLVMFRNWLGGGRDMYLAKSRDGLSFSKPEKLGTGSWPLNACPMDGGGLAAADGKIVTAWRRDTEVFLAAPGEKETRIGAGKDVALAVGGGRAHAIWTNGTKIEAWSGGKTSVLSNAGAFAALAILPNGGALAVWEGKGAIQIHSLP